MKKRIVSISAILVFLVIVVFWIASSKGAKKPSFISIDNAELIYEEIVSPNREYVESEKDIVLYEVRVYQDKDNLIIVNASSNSGFFEGMQYVVEHDKRISSSDVEVIWTTFMGGKEPTKDNQIIEGTVLLSSNGEVFHKQKINYLSKGFEMLGDALK